MSSAKAFEKGYPINVSPESFMATAEHLLKQRASNRGISEVAVKDANIPMPGAFRRDTLMPILVDYMNFVIHPQSDLKFESAMNDEVTSGVAASMASEQDREPEVTDIESAGNLVSKHLSTTPLFNAASDEGGLGVESQLREYASTPLSVTLLMLDTALESAHTLSQRYQQSSMGITEAEVLDLTPVCDLLASMNVAEHIQAMPEQLQSQLERVLTGSADASPTESLDSVLESSDAPEADTDTPSRSE